uniref:BPTI/Kunitz inhibitor domain-containing protein n=1 Tax=Scleropages formosus TaxID=113540 RepID=A0A8C9SHF2_SCLFO
LSRGGGSDMKSYGHCFNNYILWHYDSINERCTHFKYSGCGGNGNRFIDELSCNATCSGIHGRENGFAEV